MATCRRLTALSAGVGPSRQRWREDRGSYRSSRTARSKDGDQHHQARRRRPRQTADGGRVQFPTDRFFVTCHPGLEEATASELRRLEWAGVHSVEQGKAGVFCRTTDSNRTRYAANVHLAGAVRVLEVLAEGALEVVGRERAGDALYDFIRRIDWSKYIQRGSTFKVQYQ